MTNGSNSWNVSFSYISRLDRLLKNHDNVTNVERHDDIIFEIDRKGQKDHLKVLCCNEYAMGLTLVQRGLSEFGNVNIFHIGGGWNGYTSAAKEFCLAQKVGIFVSDEMTGALWKDDYWAYHRKDKKGNPSYFIREK
jgi:hypothetical protein